MTGRLATWIVIPAYNEGGTIGQIVAACRDFGFGPIVVDDGSSDRTAEIAAASGATVLRNVGNLGKGASLWRGMQAALAEGAELIATLDGDGQHRPADIAGAARPQLDVSGGNRHRLPPGAEGRRAAGASSSPTGSRISGSPGPHITGWRTASRVSASIPPLFCVASESAGWHAASRSRARS